MFSAPFKKVLNELKVSATHLNDSERKRFGWKRFCCHSWSSTSFVKRTIDRNRRKHIFGRMSCRRNTVTEWFGQLKPIWTGTRREETFRFSQQGEIFKNIYLDSKLSSAVAHVLKRDFKLSSLNARVVSKGNGYQWLHLDWKQDYDQRFHFSIQSGCLTISRRKTAAFEWFLQRIS